MQVDSFTKNLCGPSDLPDLSASGSNSMRLEEDEMDHEIEEKKKKEALLVTCDLNVSFIVHSN